ncbi:hypothetical protein LZ31DRAFT_88331 [Colletotrichum somersetense]|nr:hypothetical protein LZ31DRAFT_88331 [Colletotrichum somersetense]
MARHGTAWQSVAGWVGSSCLREHMFAYLLAYWKHPCIQYFIRPYQEEQFRLIHTLSHHVWASQPSSMYQPNHRTCEGVATMMQAMLEREALRHPILESLNPHPRTQAPRSNDRIDIGRPGKRPSVVPPSKRSTPGTRQSNAHAPRYVCLHGMACVR